MIEEAKTPIEMGSPQVVEESSSGKQGVRELVAAVARAPNAQGKKMHCPQVKMVGSGEGRKLKASHQQHRHEQCSHQQHRRTLSSARCGLQRCSVTIRTRPICSARCSNISLVCIPCTR